MAVTRNRGVLIFDSLGDSIDDQIHVYKVTFYCQAANYKATLGDGNGNRRISGSGRQYETVVLDFDKWPVEMDGIQVLEKTDTIPEIYVYYG